MNKAIRPLAAAAIAALALTGCTSWPGAGAHVGGVRIADETVVQSERVIEAGAGPWWDAVATTTVAMGKMDGKRLQQGIEGVDVEVNPRYGNWNPNSLGLVSSNLSTSIEELQLAR